MVEINGAKYVNKTPHPITIRCGDGTDINILPTFPTPRVGTNPGVDTTPKGNPFLINGAVTFGHVEDMPEPEPGVYYVVSGLVGGRLGGRADVLVPGTGPADGPVRNDKGHIVAVTRLNRV